MPLLAVEAFSTQIKIRNNNNSNFLQVAMMVICNLSLHAVNTTLPG